MNGTTSISALPNDATQNKVVLNVEEQPMKHSPQGPPPMAAQQNNNLLPTAKAPVTPMSRTFALPSKLAESVSVSVTCKALGVSSVLASMASVAVSAFPVVL